MLKKVIIYSLVFSLFLSSSSSLVFAGTRMIGSASATSATDSANDIQMSTVGNMHNGTKSVSEDNSVSDANGADSRSSSNDMIDDIYCSTVRSQPPPTDAWRKKIDDSICAKANAGASMLQPIVNQLGKTKSVGNIPPNIKPLPRSTTENTAANNKDREWLPMFAKKDDPVWKKVLLTVNETFLTITGAEAFAGLGAKLTQKIIQKFGTKAILEMSEETLKNEIKAQINAEGANATKGTVKTAKGLIGKDFESYLTKEIGGSGSFSKGGRDFDGGLGNRWWEAKSGQYWDYLQSSEKNIAKFKSDMGDRLNIAKQNGATYELHSNTPIPQGIKDWLTKKGIPFTEH